MRIPLNFNQPNLCQLLAKMLAVSLFLVLPVAKEPVAGKSDQTPEYSPIRNSGHDAGDFVFIRRKN
jgi:hypothetical protein